MKKITATALACCAACILLAAALCGCSSDAANEASSEQQNTQESAAVTSEEQASEEEAEEEAKEEAEEAGEAEEEAELKAAEEKEAREKAKAEAASSYTTSHIETKYYELDLPSYWQGKVEWKYTKLNGVATSKKTNNIVIYPKGMSTECSLCYIRVEDVDDHLDSGDISVGVVNSEDNGNGEVVREGRKNWLYFAWVCRKSSGVKLTSMTGLFPDDWSESQCREAMEDLVDLSTLGQVSYKQAKKLNADKSSSGSYEKSLIGANALWDCLTVK